LGLQLAQLHGQGVEVSLGIPPDLCHLGILVAHLLLKTLDMTEGTAAGAGHGKGNDRTDAGNAQHTGQGESGHLAAQAPAREVQRFRSFLTA
jgi:hypothetical protein